ncbi:MAG TPA: ribonuclease HII [Candidatus Saccharimonadales bacterium]|nr:ribonuclease HII [Candidatus Saccharimonadales bacterium]
MVIGIDEVGRGALAGPLCIGAVALGEIELAGLTDSKKLTVKRRVYFDRLIRQSADRAALGWVAATDIDKLGISGALRLATLRALKQIDIKPNDQIIIDGTVNFLKDSQYATQATTMKQADLLVPSVSAGSVIAKVARDNYMKSVAGLFPDYKFEAHVGYGTAGHLAAIAEYGPSPLHRLSFAPLSTAGSVVKKPAQPGSGQLAETVAADYLKRRRFKVLDRNWKTRWCEIDIVAENQGKIWLVEVKYRSSDRQGSGLDYITTKKLERMRLAARFWQHSNGHSGDIGLAAIEVGGHDYAVTNFIKNL